VGDGRRGDGSTARLTLAEVAAHVAPGMRVGIDGVSAAGKTTFADALEEVDPESIADLVVDTS